MRLMERNKSKFYYANLVSVGEQTDEYGNYIPEEATTYGEPTMMKAYISASRGENATEPFGTDLEYDKIIILSGIAPFDEHSHLWVEVEPTQPYDYIVKKVAKGLSDTTIAIKKVITNA